MTDHVEPAPGGGSGSSLLRVVSYNVRAFKDDTDALRRVISTLQPDVLCLQEVPRHPFSGHRIADFAASLGLFWGGGHRGRMSTTLLTALRVDVLDSGHRNLPVRRPDEPRGYAFARLRLPGHLPITAVSVHLSLRPAERPHHAALLRRSAELGEDSPLVIAGDINETHQGNAWTELSRDLEDANGDVLTFPSSAPVKRIDAIFASPALKPVRPQIALEEADLVAATDHRPLYLDLDLGALRLPQA
ncbi:endonuclease/exonuclease/phosphatase family protein [Luteipulveratus flavus]|uniref:Endonuclease/exonuclease/phosphatase family protein n=1 Tax=Luteipulveratus flavus TaxID=3031728 RepID=A0ABT6CAH7_9MICO|nr:endonuclease/exonuclease/phosphatase family protein [Luteipulveratus sp. YIM 133296]MDF8265795.1 endonuclease/exonuclease/phosphatase family protein [Luteipulveratus sp. YIM 133296]